VPPTTSTRAPSPSSIIDPFPPEDCDVVPAVAGTIDRGVYFMVKTTLPTDRKRGMRIGELARRSGLSRDTLRFYERSGLLTPLPSREGASNGYKDYPESLVERLALVGSAKRLGFTLREIREIIDAWQGGGLGLADRERLLRSKSAEIESRLADLVMLREGVGAALQAVMGGCEEDCLEEPQAGPVPRE
jgi:MerR family transcriptional regulator, copper efflux regulator